MKIFGIILIVLGSINIITGIVALSSTPEYADKITRQVGVGIGMLVLGIYLVNRAKKKKLEKIAKGNWNRTD